MKCEICNQEKVYWLWINQIRNESALMGFIKRLLGQYNTMVICVTCLKELPDCTREGDTFVYHYI